MHCSQVARNKNCPAKRYWQLALKGKTNTVPVNSTEGQAEQVARSSGMQAGPPQVQPSVEKNDGEAEKNKSLIDLTEGNYEEPATVSSDCDDQDSVNEEEGDTDKVTKNN